VSGILDEDMQRVVREQRLGFVATTCPDGTPNVSPKGTTDVFDADHLVFADICSPQTVANLLLNPAVEINVVDPLLRKGYRFKGRATVHRGGPQFDQALARYRARGMAHPVHAIVLVRVERALPLVSPAYDDGTIEREVTARWERYWLALWATRRERECDGLP
jgi:predicted pyridoxine 5'-phosphate oxidase superfamily flavin-nucleotide-binding protein